MGNRGFEPALSERPASRRLSLQNGGTLLPFLRGAQSRHQSPALLSQNFPGPLTLTPTGSRERQDSGLAEGSDGTTLLTWSVVSGYWAEPVGTKPSPVTIYAALGRDGVWEAPTTLAAGRDGDGQPAAAVGATGLAAVGWLGTEHGNAIVRVSMRRVGAPTWGPEAKVSFEDGQAEPPQLGIDAQGNVTAIWKVSHVDVESSTLPAGSDVWPRPVVISGPSESAGRVTLAVNASGDAIAVWNSFGEVVAAMRPADAATWGPPVVVSGVAEVVRGDARPSTSPETPRSCGRSFGRIAGTAESPLRRSTPPRLDSPPSAFPPAGASGRRWPSQRRSGTSPQHRFNGASATAGPRQGRGSSTRIAARVATS